MAYVTDRAGIDRLIGSLVARGFHVIGPTLDGDVVDLGPVGSTADLAVGTTSVPDAGRYRIAGRGDDALFGAVVGPSSVKRYLHPPVATLVEARRAGAGFTAAPGESATPTAFVGVRPCDVAAVGVQDRVFVDGPRRDAVYGPRRDASAIVAVNCTEPAATCFCASVGTGPRVGSGSDVALTEVVDGDEHWFLVEVGSPLGADLVDDIGAKEATDEQRATCDRLLDEAAGRMGRSLDVEAVPDALAGSLESPRWEEIAGRCLTCANCTLVCPTCFCASVDDHTSLTGEEAVRVRRWDSCFNEEFSYIHGGALRPSPAARYRQWLTHKLSTWVDQFGVLGCVGCGRCITWCPARIDITEEAAAFQREVAHA
ncbi:MAG: 4Fe-4S dicluster domain-containing protein [Acidimicrobiia bacterium]|nr:4Fe-4S dicluster domain-containing protein [Acidimicrobiia bacterium]